MSALSRPEFHSEEAAFSHLEKIVWADGCSCPHCGGMDRITKVKANPAKRIREGLWRCGDYKKQFTVKVGTVFEHIDNSGGGAYRAARGASDQIIVGVKPAQCGPDGVSIAAIEPVRPDFDEAYIPAGCAGIEAYYGRRCVLLDHDSTQISVAERKQAAEPQRSGSFNLLLEWLWL